MILFLSDGMRREGRDRNDKSGAVGVAPPAPRLHPTVDQLPGQVCLEAHQNLPLFSLGSMEIGP